MSQERRNHFWKGASAPACVWRSLPACALFSHSSEDVSCLFSARSSKTDTYLSYETRGSPRDALQVPLGGRIEARFLPSKQSRRETPSERAFGENGVFSFLASRIRSSLLAYRSRHPKRAPLFSHKLEHRLFSPLLWRRRRGRNAAAAALERESERVESLSNCFLERSSRRRRRRRKSEV